MRVYEYVDAQEHAETWMEDLDDEQLETSVYHKVDQEVPACIRKHSKALKYNKARVLLETIRTRTDLVRQLVDHLLEMDARGQGHEHKWPGCLKDQDVPGIDDWLMDAESSRPGCLITWHENDAVNACFDEEAQHMGENGPCLPNVALPIKLDQPGALDSQVRKMLDHAAKMLLCVQRDHTSGIVRYQAGSREFKVVAFCLQDIDILTEQPIFVAGVAVLPQERVYVRRVPHFVLSVLPGEELQDKEDGKANHRDDQVLVQAHRNGGF
jgi:hypothetical protein